MDFSVLALQAPSAESLPFEIVERKGLGHPDTICDALVENLSAGLARVYHERCGLVLHHNLDKALLVGGAARAAFGAGEVLEPIEIILAGRATNRLLLAGVALELVLIAAIVYTPAGQALFGTAPLAAAAWLFMLPFAAATLLLEEARKLVVRSLDPRQARRPAAPAPRRRAAARSPGRRVRAGTGCASSFGSEARWSSKRSCLADRY